MSKLFRPILTAVLLLYSATTFSQNAPEMADTMRNNGKIYVVVAVCLIILAGLFAYLISIERKIRRLEKRAE